MAARRGPGRGETRPSDGLGVRPKGRAATGPNDFFQASPIEHAAWHEPASSLPPVGTKAARRRPWRRGSGLRGVQVDRGLGGLKLGLGLAPLARAGEGGQLGLEFLDVGDEAKRAVSERVEVGRGIVGVS